jgi:hypothetical protein
MMALPSSPPPLFAVFRRELQLFEILKPVLATTNGEVKRLAYGAPTHVPMWTVVRTETVYPDLDCLTGTTHSFTIKGKSVEYTYTGTALVADKTANSNTHPQPIPIVHFSKTRYFPSALQGVRVIYSDGIQPAYFFKPAHWSLQPKPMLEKPAVTHENTLQVVTRQPLINEEEIAEEMDRSSKGQALSTNRQDGGDPIKVGSCLSILLLFFLTAYLSSRSVKPPLIPDLDPYNPFDTTCALEDADFFQDRFSAYYP